MFPRVFLVLLVLGFRVWVFFLRFFLARHEDFVDAGAVHIDDFKGEAVPAAFFRDFRDVAEVGSQRSRAETPGR